MAANFAKLTTKTKLSETQYYSVVKVKGDKVQLQNDFGESIVVDKPYVEKCLVASDEVTETKKMSRTDITNLFLNASNVACTVNYNTKVKEDEVKAALHALYPNKGGIISEADFKKKVNEVLKSALVGEERTMVGRHYGSQDEFGRIKFIDMEEKKDPAKEYDTRQRLVDPRTINWLILRGVKYEVK